MQVPKSICRIVHCSYSAYWQHICTAHFADAAGRIAPGRAGPGAPRSGAAGGPPAGRPGGRVRHLRLTLAQSRCQGPGTGPGPGPADCKSAATVSPPGP